ncbi:O-antigen ligase family protein, partial [bacterium]|nr:O-antigen ligase family protein [bacterium]
IWTAVTRAIADFPVFGTGIGSHREIYPTYLSEVPDYDLHEFTHAENGYLQLCLEAGSVGLSLALVGFVIAIFWCLTGIKKAKSSEITLAFAAGLAAILANLAHSATDFVWYCPACVVVVILLAACMCRTRQMLHSVNSQQSGTQQVGFRMPNLGWIAGIILLAVMSNWMVSHKVPRMLAEKPWHDYLRLATALLPDEDKSDTETFREKLLALTEADRADPNYARIQARLGRSYLTLFQMLQSRSENPMSLSQFREAALASKFENKEELLEWLNRATGERLKYLELALHHSKRSVELCPLQGQAYLYLSELSFLEMADAEARDEYIAQALAVRPYHPYILFEAGKEALMSLKTDTAMKHWKAAFDRNDLVRDKIVQLLTPVVAAPVMLDTFKPDVAGLELIAGYYRGLNRQADLRIVLDSYATRSRELATQDDIEAEEAVEHLMAAQRCYAEMGDLLKVRQCLEAAIEVDPGAYNPRLAYGNWLFGIKRYSEAAEHLIWCAKRRPNDDRITTLAAYVRKVSMQQTRSSAFSESNTFTSDKSSSPNTQPPQGDNSRQPTQMAIDPSATGNRF